MKEADHKRRDLRSRLFKLTRGSHGTQAIRERMQELEAMPIFWGRCRACGSRREGTKADLLKACEFCGYEGQHTHA